MYFEDYKKGQKWEITPYTISADEIHSFAELYDPLPMHIDDEYAAHTRFKGLIASGPLGFLSFWSRFLSFQDGFCEGLIAGISSSNEYMRPIYAGDSLHGLVTVVDTMQRNSYNGAVSFDAQIINQEGITVTTGHVVVCFELREPRPLKAGTEL
jgi:acyl dehydratase